MNENAMLTGKPSIDRPWMKFYPEVLRGIQVPACTVSSTSPCALQTLT